MHIYMYGYYIPVLHMHTVSKLSKMIMIVPKDMAKSVRFWSVVSCTYELSLLLNHVRHTLCTSLLTHRLLSRSCDSVFSLWNLLPYTLCTTLFTDCWSWAAWTFCLWALWQQPALNFMAFSYYLLSSTPM